MVKVELVVVEVVVGGVDIPVFASHVSACMNCENGARKNLNFNHAPKSFEDNILHHEPAMLWRHRVSFLNQYFVLMQYHCIPDP